LPSQINFNLTKDLPTTEAVHAAPRIIFGLLLGLIWCFSNEQLKQAPGNVTLIAPGGFREGEVKDYPQHSADCNSLATVGSLW
jgi:hypothetical protein